MGTRSMHVLRLSIVALIATALHGARAEDVRGVVAGVAAYEDAAIVAMPAAGRAARAAYDALAALDTVAGGLSAVGVDRDASEAPGRDDILGALGSIADGGSDADIAIVYCAGQVMSRGAEGFLLARDSVVSDLPGTAVALAAVGDAFARVKADQKLLVLSVATGGASPDNAFYEALVRMRDVTVLVGSGPGEGLTSMDDGGDAFTHFLVKTLAAASSGPLSLRKLSYGVWATTRRWAEGKGTQQTPQYMPAGRGAAPASADEELVVLETTQGRIVIRLYEGDAPLHVANFKKLAREGFYEGDARSFHRYEKGFVIQGGDPWGLDPARAGKGGPGYTVPEEIKRKHVRGAVAAARQGDSTNPERRSSGSQFYICLGRPFHLNGKYTVFGQVIEGMGAVDKLRVGDEMTKTSVIPASEHKPDK